ncbi:GNAT family N-acetyltransferase [Azospirillum picis]|uniref:RimJ/RimL family protein N-acetyltransferase n=1 Tax=Azospirillum picis TaxID=488438 RepID=A0ABU0MQK7_9PROT|nr:GNAT family N-acetyltransferase [Azospirillum picis]MBP2302178.1 RimJ/RimL family protein N-acetyltransferase [Azospirillum picis]MDQ0535757.1 RimJ/RimL family protein N-acetyltransferase [Azospirillum picis]
MIESERLLLRPPQIGDFEQTAQMLAETAVMTHIGGSPLNREEAWARFLRDAGHWAVESFGLFSVIEKSSGLYVGKVGYARFERPLGDHARTSVEMSWTLRSRFHGRGYATEAAVAAQGRFSRSNRQRTACLIAPANGPSLKLAARLGYRQVDRIMRGQGEVVVLVHEP